MALNLLKHELILTFVCVWEKPDAPYSKIGLQKREKDKCVLNKIFLGICLAVFRQCKG